MADRDHARKAMARLTRAIESTDPALEGLAERLGITLIEALSDEEALGLEHRITLMAQAAEELGPDASVEEIAGRARQLAARPN